ncbi:mandelate racemase/muconate lactonizing enzyme family protein [Salmonella enterica subsp. enterica serovar Teshie]|uniref:Mandelate racemase/muconate lactonizing enzyme family protein n=1 Tax=Salmonella enterica TaxID=28901 RepID=A0A763SRH9_SALER|nr:mandelate racemase/muconate lactonizing enzyme family protein [Salmonella enterica]EBR9809801.1 mandelate racemase/muconate lactonizing enzyme family protein [Salmonella enterica subsp. enterica serovar Teshie]ECD6621150.1 mandelate racemase/muconate lactonizing enzyme family protein [Salmonella enterica subsp. enterica]EBA4958886.1 mandelate racemase/muconate lactonizing enzyme family protein [Salmonella enterica]EBU9726423.1 mandelate racemase/muconate lactonizing enzyme family protein [Sa
MSTQSTLAQAGAFDHISWIKLSSVNVPLNTAVSDAKVLTGRQNALKDVALLVAEIETEQGFRGLGFTYTLRNGGPAQFSHTKEMAPLLIGEDPNDIPRLWSKLVWAGASVGRSGLATQAIAAFDTALWDLKAKRANLSLAKLLGAQRNEVRCYNTSGGYLQASVDEIIDKSKASLARGIGGIKMKVGHPDRRQDLQRVDAIRKALGDDTPLMVDVNQQWDRTTALRMGMAMEQYNLQWIEEPLDAYDVDGHRMLSSNLVTPVGTGEMLTSAGEVAEYIRQGAVDLVMHDAPRIGGITPFLKVQQMAEDHGLMMAPHFVMEIHLHLAAAYAHETWVEHFEWLEPVFNERLEIRDGQMIVPTRPGLGLSLHEQTTAWTVASFETGKRH